MAIQIDILENLASLADLPAESGSREALLWRVADTLFASTEAPSESDRNFFGVMMEELAFGLEREVREELARKIAAEERTPHNLALRLAHDEIPVARPVLQQSPVLTEDDLIKVSDRESQDHLLAVTQRMEVGIRLAAVLAERGNDDVIRSLTQNPNAKLSPATVGLVADRSRSCEKIQAALVAREDVPQEILFSLLDHVSEKIRAEIQDKITQVDEAYLDDTVSSMKSNIQSCPKTRARRRIEDLEQRGALNEQAVLGFLKDEKPIEFLLGIARLFAIDVMFARRIISEPSGQALAVACRANDISVDGLKEIASSPMTATSSDPSRLLPLVNAYRRISEIDAQRTLYKMQHHDHMPLQ